MSENITNVKLLYVPLDNEYKHTLYFKDLASQLAYFNAVSGARSFSDFSYQPKESRLRVALSLDEAMKYNYVMYKNTNYSNKNFFAFITGYEWKNDNLTELTLETDVMQTWMFDITIKPSFIEREHTDDDSIGANTISENLEIGEYIINKEQDLLPFKSLSIVMGLTAGANGTPYRGKRYNGSYSGIHYKAFPLTTAGVNALNGILEAYDGGGINDAVVSLFLAPSELAKTWTDGTSSSFEVEASETPYNMPFNLTYSRKGFKNYTPKNNKLFTYPYNYLLISNNAGGSAIYQFEHFTNTENRDDPVEDAKIFFVVYGVLTPGCSIRLIPMSYKGTLTNHEEGLNLGKYPICNWLSDEFTNWLTQNSVNIGLNLVGGLGQMIGGAALGVASGGLGSAIGLSMSAGGLSSITNQLTQIHQMSFTPPQANGNINSGDVVTAINKNTFTCYQMCCKPEYMRVIDEYFSSYGYKTNRIKVPNSNHRENWWFTKTVDINITGQIPITDKAKIEACYNNGITFWRSASNMKNYSLSNNIL